MKKGIWLPVLLASSVLGAAPAFAQANADDIAQLKAQMQAMQARLDALQAQQAVAAAAPAPTPVAAPAPAPSGWFSDTTIGGKAYLNASVIDQKSNGADSTQNGFQADAKRFYLSVDHNFNKVFSADLTTDFRYGSNGLTNDDVIYIKKAYLQAKLSDAFWVRLGAADLPWVPFVENIYNYRFVENTIIERVKYGTSSDWGIHVGGALANGLVSYQVSAIDGLGYKTRTRNSDTLDLEGRVSVSPIKSITLAVGGYTGKLGKSVSSLPDTPHRASRFDALAAYTDHGIRAGVEYFEATDWNNVTTVQSNRSDGWSAFGSYSFTPQVALFGRYDWVNPDQRTNAPLKEHYFNVGLDFIPVKNIDLAAVYKRDKADNGLVSTSNGNIGGSIDGTYDEFGIFTQLKF